MKEFLLLQATTKLLLGVTTDSELTFENHITELCLKVSKKLNALCRVSDYMSTEKHGTLIKAFTELQFNYYPWYGCFMLGQRIIKSIAFTRQLSRL